MNYPFTKKVDVVDDYHGTKVADPYRWLEETNSPEAQGWLSEQIKLTESYFSGVAYREQIREKVGKFFRGDRYSFASNLSRAGQMIFFRKTCQADGRTKIIMKNGNDGVEELLFDPGNFTESFAGVGVRDVSDDGKYCMISLYKLGSDYSEIYVVDLLTKKALQDKPVRDFGTPNFWKDGFIYTSPKREDDSSSGKLLSMSIKFHRLGTDPENDEVLVECSDLGIDEESAAKLSNLFCWVENGWMIVEAYTDSWSFFFKKADDPNKTFRRYFDQPKGFFCGFRGSIDGKIVYQNDIQMMLVDFDKPEKENCIEVFDLQNSNIQPESIRVIRNNFFAHVMVDSRSVLQQFDSKGQYEKTIDVDNGDSLYTYSGKVVGNDDKMIPILRTSFVNPDQLMLFDLQSGYMEPIPLKDAQTFDRIEIECMRVLYKSKDGTMIPLTMYFKKGLDIEKINPILMEGYGGYGTIHSPYFRVRARLFVEQGGIFAIAGVRGGGEFGESWHKAGSRENKQNSIDDFVTAAQYLISQGFTDAKHLAILGGLEGARLISTSMNQRPDLFAVVIAENGAYDKLRFHKFSFSRKFTSESGCSDNPDEFGWIYKLSPLHNVSNNTNYPAVMIVTSSNDTKCQPLHSFKFVSTLQEVQCSNKPVLLKYLTDCGHFDRSPDKIIDENTDILSFIYKNIDFVPNF